MAIFETPRPHVSRLVVTGATGGIGTMLRGKLDDLADEIILSGRKTLEVTGKERFTRCDLSDLDSVRALLKGGGDVLHFGGQSVEAPFEVICQANLIGTYNLYEAARLEGVRRILFASSNHAIGFHRRKTKLDSNSLTRPDTLYGVSKVYGEALAQLYYDKFGIESLILRIGTCAPKPMDHRQMATWLDLGDLIDLCQRMIETPFLGCPIVYGVSDNTEAWWDNSQTQYLGWTPQKNSEQWREEVEASAPAPDPNAPETLFQGGKFVSMDHPSKSGK